MKQKEHSARDVPGLNAILLILLISGSIGNRLCQIAPFPPDVHSCLQIHQDQGSMFSWLNIGSTLISEPSLRPHMDSKSANRRCQLCMPVESPAGRTRKALHQNVNWAVLSVKKVWSSRCNPDMRKGVSNEA